MQIFKWCAITFLVGAILSAGAVLYFVYRPASITITDLQRKSKQLSEQHRIEADEDSKLLKEARETIEGLANDLARAGLIYQETIDGVKQLEDQVRSLEESNTKIQESSGRASEYNRSIRGEAENALRDLRGFRRDLAEDASSNGARTSSEQD